MELKKHRKYIQRGKTKLISPPLESFHRDFKIAAYVFNSVPENYQSLPTQRADSSFFHAFHILEIIHIIGELLVDSKRLDFPIILKIEISYKK
jgi:hypothetical protein